MITIGLIVLILLVTIFTFLQKVRLKSKMEGGLGRKVKDSELTSINAWMNASSSPRSGDTPPKSNS